MQAMTQTADKVSEKAVPVTEKVTSKIEEKAAQVRVTICHSANLLYLHHAAAIPSHLLAICGSSQQLVVAVNTRVACGAIYCERAAEKAGGASRFAVQG